MREDIYWYAEVFFNGPGHGRMPQSVADYLGQTRPDLYNELCEHLAECGRTTESAIKAGMEAAKA